MALSGHYWTIYPTLKHAVAPAAPPGATPWSVALEDPVRGAIVLTGAHRDIPGSDTCVVIVHGLAGKMDTFYNLRAAHAAEQLGISSLRIALRGADRSGEDFYHGGLVEDLNAALASPALARYRHLLVMGYSLGGHMSLRWALSPSDARVRAVAAVCAPLVLGASGKTLDHPSGRLYRRAILRGLQEIYAAVAARKDVPTPLAEVQQARTLREWDELTVVPRFGFQSVDDYYERMSVGPLLGDLAVPALIVHSDHDPMITPATFEHFTRTPLARVTWCRVRAGGHVAFPDNVDLGLERAPRRGRDNAEKQALRWLSLARDAA